MTRLCSWEEFVADTRAVHGSYKKAEEAYQAGRATWKETLGVHILDGLREYAFVPGDWTPPVGPDDVKFAFAGNRDLVEGFKQFLIELTEPVRAAVHGWNADGSLKTGRVDWHPALRPRLVVRWGSFHRPQSVGPVR